MKTQKAILFAAIVCSLFACKKSKDDNVNPSNTMFDKKALLSNIGNNIIIPSYQTLQARINTLDSMTTAFNAAPDASGLAAEQNALKEAYKAWQMCSSFELGAAEQANMNLNGNTFPTSVSTINSNIASGTYDLTIASNISAKGLPAADYLLFGSDNTSLLTLFTTDANATNRKKYLADIIRDLKTTVTTVANSWPSTGGNYISTFISADGTDIGSSLGKLINKLDYDYDVLKNNKLGIPMGKQSMGAIHPEKTEAYYSGISAQLMVLQLQSIQNIYLGKSAQGDGSGLDDYLANINARYNGGSLNDTIKNQISVTITKMQAISEPLSAAIQSNAPEVTAAYTEVQKLLVLLKTDMPSAMGVLITYVDNDGD